VSEVRSRRHAREVALRVLYQAELNDEKADEVVEQALEGGENDETARFVRRLVETVTARREEIDRILGECSTNWSLERMASTDRNVLRLAVAELLAVHEVDARVTLDEAIEIADRYGTDDSARFVNGILDRVAHQLRPDEFPAQ
jgi:N utilization substance protein B